MVFISACTQQDTTPEFLKEYSINATDYLLVVDEKVVDLEVLNAMEESEIYEIKINRGPALHLRFGDQGKEGTIAIFTNAFEERRQKQLFTRLQGYLTRNATAQGEYWFVMNGVPLKENWDSLYQLSFSQLLEVGELSAKATKMLYGDQTTGQTVLVNTKKKRD
ncbi:hypothetical protein [Persicobacter diffluens]|uniref:hypothetical protein n=1 Tax=Persicobacter diffluens TaxID=981 RepID=UPI0030C6FCDA